MGKPLEGIKVVEVAMWAFVPAAGGILSDMGANVIKVEPPTGDPIRGLGPALRSAEPTVDFSWESYNRGKRSITLDLKQDAGARSALPAARGRRCLPHQPAPACAQVDGDRRRHSAGPLPEADLRQRQRLGQNGPDSDKGGYDAITFWARGGVSSSVTEPDAELPVGPPGPAFGDSLSGSMLAGGDLPPRSPSAR